jgi:hypothetical protein
MAIFAHPLETVYLASMTWVSSSRSITAPEVRGDGLQHIVVSAPGEEERNGGGITGLHNHCRTFVS